MLFCYNGMMKSQLIAHIAATLARMGMSEDSFKLDFTENPEHGDFSTNAAMVNAKKLGLAPKELAVNIVTELATDQPDFISEIEIAGPGFINFKIKDSVFVGQIIAAIKAGEVYGWGTVDTGRKIMVEYTDPNPFKIFHIGHLMSNAIGESISRLLEVSGGDVIRACYQGDVGLHVAKTIWAAQRSNEAGLWLEGGAHAGKCLTEKVAWLGTMYVEGSKFDDDIAIQKEIAIVNKKIFEKSDPVINDIYEQGRKWSLDYFETIYDRLGTQFHEYIFESEVADMGVRIVREFIGKGVFVESEGAVVFKGEDHGLHTRVFLTSQGLPTYETKELGNNTKKFNLFPELAESVIITANEQTDYFRVLLKVFSIIDPNIFKKTRHISHGLMRFASGKMSSRKGNIVSAESLIEDIRTLVGEKLADRELTPAEKSEISDIVAIGAIKYTILRQAIGGDVIFDTAASISFEGDSGPYLQYAAVRAGSLLEKAAEAGMQARVFADEGTARIVPDKVTDLEKLLSRFPDVVARARAEYAPQLVSTYLIALAGAFNAYYANNTIIDVTDPLSPYRVALTEAFRMTLVRGLWILGIKVPKRM
jgi:arginyl-tRNA synthetase